MPTLRSYIMEPHACHSDKNDMHALQLLGKLFEADNHGDYVVTQYLLDMAAVPRTNEAHRIK